MTDSSATSPSTAPGLVHEALIYRAEPELTEAVSGFLEAAAEAEEPVLVALPGENLERLRDLVGEDPGLTYEDICEIGRNPSRLLPRMQEWIAGDTEGEGHGGGRMRIVAEPVWPGRSYAETAECLRHEALVNRVLADAPVSILCPYDAARLDAETLAGVELTHPSVLDGGRRRPSLAYPGLPALDLDGIWPLEPPSGPVHEHGLGASLCQLRQAVAEDPLVGGLSPGRRSDLVLAVNEAATNAVLYGDGGCSARLWHDGRGLVTEITSDSAVPDPMYARRSRPDPGADSGRGLWLINQVCDLVEMRCGDQGMTLRLHMDDTVH